MTFDHADGGVLAMQTAEQLAEPDRDLDLLEAACIELARRINRGDLMVGILPLEAIGVTVAGLSAAGRAGRSRAWIELGLCYLGTSGELLGPADWPSRFPFGDDPGTQLGKALRCLAEAAMLSDRDGALLFGRAARNASDEARLVALDYLRPYAEADDEAAYRLGLVLQWLGDNTAAAGHHLRAAGHGHADAAFELYVLHSTGTGVARDDGAAHAWLMRAAELDQPRALYNVAAAYATGNGFSQDLAQAVTYYRRAARAGNGRAAATLGVMYLTGDGVERDEATAAQWLDDAEDLGHPVDEWLDQLGLPRPGPTALS